MAAQGKPLALANSQEEPFEALQNDSTELDADGWALIAPFGNHAKTRVYRENGLVKEQKFIQVLDNESADALVNGENSFFRKLKRALIGIPVYKGHGDLNDVDPKAVANETQKIKLGVVDQIRKSARGIEAHFALDNDGAEAVAAGWKLPSAFWLVMPIGNEGDAIRARPFKLLSVALTQFPNISGVESLANARPTAPAPIPTKQTTTYMTLKDNLIGLLIGRGVQLPADCTEQQVFNALANADPDGAEPSADDAAKLTRKAHLTSARATTRETHITAAVAHQGASDAHKAGGDSDCAEMHDSMAKFHIRQAGKN